MRFDLEIYPTNNFELSYLKDEMPIGSSSVPLFYNMAETIDIFPENFISVKENYVPQNAFTDSFTLFTGGKTELISDNFLLTNVKKYSQNGEALVPLFYKHVINMQVDPYKIRLVDFFGTEISRSDYLIDVRSTETVIYKNKSNEILFIDYFVNNKPQRKLLNLERVFTEMTSMDVLEGKTGELDTYTTFDNILRVGYSGEMFLTYVSDNSIIKAPSGNLEDIWTIDILNISFMNNGLKYKTTDYYLQNFFGYNNSTLIEKCKCYKISGSLVRTQFPIAKNFMQNIEVFVYDFYSNNLVAAYSSNNNIINRVIEGVSYTQLPDANYDGYITLPINLDDTHIVFCTQYTDSAYFPYNNIDLNQLSFSKDITLGLFLRPYSNDDTPAVGHSVIGVDFQDKATYESNLGNNYHLGYVSPIPIKRYQKSPIELQRTGNVVQLSTKQEALKKNIDVLLKDISDENIFLKLEDTVIARTEASPPDNTLAQVRASVDASTKSFLRTIG